MKKFVLIILSIMLVGFGLIGAAEKTVKVKSGTKGKIDLKKKMARIQANSDDQADIVLLTSYVANDRDEIGNCVDLYGTEFIDYYVEYVSFSSSKVRFHFIWTGPEFYTHTTDWIETGYYEYDWLSVETSTDWLPGTYKLVIMAEHEYGQGSGMQTVAQSRIVFY